MSRIGRLSVGACLVMLVVSVLGCGGKPDKAEVEKRARGTLAAASSEWKDVTYDTRVDGTVSVVLASRELNGKTYDFSLTGGNGFDVVQLADQRQEQAGQLGVARPAVEHLAPRVGPARGAHDPLVMADGDLMKARPAVRAVVPGWLTNVASFLRHR